MFLSCIVLLPLSDLAVAVIARNGHRIQIAIEVNDRDRDPDRGRGRGRGRGRDRAVGL